MYKDEKTLVQSVQKIIVFIVLYANLWRSRRRRRPTKTRPFVLLNTVFLWPSQFEQKQHTSSGNKFVAPACMLFLYSCSRIFARENTLQVVLVLVLLIIGGKSGGRLLNQSQSVAAPVRFL